MLIPGALLAPFALSNSAPSTLGLSTLPAASTAGGGSSGSAVLASFSQALRAALARPSGGALGGHGGRRPESGAQELDAAMRHVAHLAPPGFGFEGAAQPRLATPAPPPQEPARGPLAPTSLEELLPALVRKIAWSGDGRRGAVRIELGAGALAGATLLVLANRGRVHVTLSARAPMELEPWRERIVARLAARGLEVDVE
jgi:hypothetical protein